MSKVKQILAGVLSASMIVTLMPAVTFAAPTSVTYTDNTGATVTTTTLEDAIAKVANEGKITVTGGTIDTSVVINKNSGFEIILDGATLAEGVTITADEGTEQNPLHPCFIQTSTGWKYHPTHKFTSADGIVSSKDATTTHADIQITCQYGCEGVKTTASGNATVVKSEGGFNYYTGTIDSESNTTNGWIKDRYIADVDANASVTYRELITPATITYRVDKFDYQKTTPENMATSSPVSFFANLQSSTDGTTYTDVKDSTGTIQTVTGTIAETNRLTEGQIDSLVSQAATGTKVYVANKGTDGVAAEAAVSTGTKNYAADAAATADKYGTHSYKLTFTLDSAYGGATTTIYLVNVIDEAKLDSVKNGVGKFQALFADEDGNEKWVDFLLTGTTKNALFTFVSDADTGIPVVTPNGNDTKYYLVLSPEGNFTYRPVFISTKDATEAQKAAGDAIGDKAAIYGDAETYNALTTSQYYKKYECGTATYVYAPAGVTVSYKNELTGNVEASTLTVQSDLSPNNWIKLTGKDTHKASNIDDWAVAYTNSATHHSTGSENVVCKVCGNTYAITYPKKDEHTFILAPGSINAKVTSVEATCKHPSFNYKECSLSNGSIEDAETADNWYLKDEVYSYKLTLNKSKKWYYTFTATITSNTATIKDESGNVVEENIDVVVDNGKRDIQWHPVAESIGSAVGDHSLRLKTSPAPIWDTDLASKELTDDVTVEVAEECEDCGTSFTYVYHKQTYDEYKAAYLKANTGATKADIELDAGSTDTATVTTTAGGTTTTKIHVFGKVTYTVTTGADCTKPDKFVYSVENVVPGKTISSNEVESTKYYGPHTYKNSVVWAENGETADIMQQCTVTGCVDHEDLNGNKKVQTVKAVVTPTENADGSTTYTATLLGQTLTDNTKTVINLAKAVVVVNGGNDVDLNNYTLANIKGLTTVTINGVEIDPKEWTVEGTALIVGNNTVKIVPAAKSATYTPIAVNSKDVTFKCTKLPTMEIATLKFDGNLSTSTAFDPTITYDTEAHPFEVTLKDSTTKRAVEDATIEYLAIGVTRELNRTTGKYTYEFVDLDGNDITDDVMRGDFSNLEFVKELSLVDAGAYEIYVKMSKDGYSTQYALAAGWDYDDVTTIDGRLVEGFDPFYDGPIVISPFDTKATLTVNKQLLTYGEELIATTGDVQRYLIAFRHPLVTSAQFFHHFFLCYDSFANLDICQTV